MPDVAAAPVELKRMGHERRRALHRKLFEDQMRALANDMQGFAISALTMSPRVSALLTGEDNPPSLPTSLVQDSLDVDHMAHVVGTNGLDKRKSVTYAPIARS
ncbi:unnamed protein product [Peniophora sp. CBMAI 1063]|nr:unnamed protein product [Peniophora sp. CBMAI 1063]